MTSVWNTPLNKSNVDVDSATYIATLCANGPPDIQTVQKMSRFAFPLYWGNDTDQQFEIVLDHNHDGIPSTSTDYSADIQGLTVYAPENIIPSAGSDGAFKLLDQPGGYVYHFRVASVNYFTNTINAQTGYRLAIGGSGFNHTHETEPPTGLLPVRPEDLDNGFVNHCVNIHIPSTSGVPVAPYDTSGGHGQYVSDGIPAEDHLSFGNIIFLDLDVEDIDALSISTAQKAVCKGLATYGGLVGFNGGSSWTLAWEHAYDRTAYGKRDPWEAVGVTFPFNFQHALDDLGGWEANLRVLEPFARPSA